MKTKTIAVTIALVAVIICAAVLACGGTPQVSGGAAGDALAAAFPAVTLQKGLPYTYAGRNYTSFIVKRSPDGSRYATAKSVTPSDVAVLKIWDVKTNLLLQTFPARDNVFDFEWSANGRWIAIVEQEKDGTGKPRSNTSGSIAILDTLTGTRVMTIEASLNSSAVFSTDNRYVQLNNGKVYEAATGTLTEAPPRTTFRERTQSEAKDSTEVMRSAYDNYQELATAVSWDANGSRIMFTSQKGDDLMDYRFVIWDAATGSMARSFNLSLAYETNLVRPNQDGTTAATNMRRNGWIMFYNIETGKRNEGFAQTRSNNNEVIAESLAWSPNSRQAAIISVVIRGKWPSFQGDLVEVYDTANGRLIHTLLADVEVKDTAEAIAKREQFYDIAWSPDGAQVAAVGNKHLRIWNPANGAIIVNAAVSEKENEVRFRGDTQIFFTGAEGTAVAYNANGRQLVYGRADGAVVLYDTQARRDLRKFDGLTNRVVKVAFSPDSSRIVAVDVNGAVKVWNASSGETVQTAQARFSNNLSPAKVSINPDASRIAFVAADATVEVLHIASGKSATLAMWSATEWAAAAAEGISFVASPSAIQRINIRNGSKAEPVTAYGSQNNPAALLEILSGGK